MTPRVRLLSALTGATARRIAWWSVAGCIVSMVTITWLIASRDATTTSQVITTLRWSSVLLAGGVATVFDDPTEDDLAGAITPVWRRRTIALLLVLLPTAAGWGAAMALVPEPLPWAALSLEAGALVLLGCAAVSNRPSRRSNLPAGVTASLVPAFLLAVANLLPQRVALLADHGDTQAWRQVHVRWAWLAGAALIALTITARDPARRSARRVLQPARANPDAPLATSATTTPDTLPEAS